MDIGYVRQLIQDAPLRLLASRLRRARRDCGLSHDRIAEQAGTSRQHLINLEKGRHRPRPEMLAAIAEATGKPIEFFVVEEAGDRRPFPVEAA